MTVNGEGVRFRGQSCFPEALKVHQHDVVLSWEKWHQWFKSVYRTSKTMQAYNQGPLSITGLQVVCLGVSRCGEEF